MPMGGRREGSGRKKGGVNTKTREIADAAAKQGITPLEVMINGMRILWKRSEDADHTGPELMAAIASAEKAAPYMHARIASVQHNIGGADGGPLTVIVKQYPAPGD